MGSAGVGGGGWGPGGGGGGGGVLGLPLADEGLLRAVQLGRLYADSKEFVDMPLACTPERASQGYEECCSSAVGQRPGKEALVRFIAEHFSAAGSDLERAELEDWRAEPTGFLPGVSGEARDWALAVHALWKELGRRTSPNIATQPERHSLLPLPHPTVVPGGRFRETYYWDSFWIVQGLLVSHMPRTATGIVTNLVHLLRIHGKVPNGGRTYYLGRSQPPLLSQMLRVLWEARGVEGVRGPRGLVECALGPLLEEHRFMTDGNRTVLLQDRTGDRHSLARHFVETTEPRPESFWEDYELAESLQGQGEKENLFAELASAAESGWDFSSRWMAGGGVALQNLNVRRVVPVDLNVFLVQMEENIAFFADKLNRPDIRAEFLEHARKRREAVESVLWDPTQMQWKDFLLETYTATEESGGVMSGCLSEQVVASNYLPLWLGMGDAHGSAIIGSLKASGLVLPGGISTSLVESGQQWDHPNAWPPLQHMLIEGVARHDEPFAKSLAHCWLQSNLKCFKATGCMQEKYDARCPGQAGSGGEYTVQAGFGWTNGVALVLLEKYGFAPASCAGSHRD